jgi:hypothetical protein
MADELPEDEICLERERAAFFAAYHAQWIQSERRWIFDPLLKPGDPEHCWRAWLIEREVNG